MINLPHSHRNTVNTDGAGVRHDGDRLVRGQGEELNTPRSQSGKIGETLSYGDDVVTEVVTETAGSHEEVLVGDREDGNGRQRQQIRSPNAHGRRHHVVPIPLQSPHRAVEKHPIHLKRDGVCRRIAVGDGASRRERGVEDVVDAVDDEILVDVQIWLADLDGGDWVGERRRRNRDLARVRTPEQVEAVVVVERAELVAVVARGEGGPGEDEGRPEGVVEEDWDGGARRRAVAVENPGGG